MNKVELFDGERLELGDKIVQGFAANMAIVYEVVGLNPDYAFLYRMTDSGLDTDHTVQIPLVWHAEDKCIAYRDVQEGTVVVH